MATIFLNTQTAIHSDSFQSIKPDPEIQDFLLKSLYSMDDDTTYNLYKKKRNSLTLT